MIRSLPSRRKKAGARKFDSKERSVSGPSPCYSVLMSDERLRPEIKKTAANGRRGRPTGVPHDERLWRALTKRNAAADGTFVYAVSSTGIYCRPSCPSKRPHRANVVFFAGPRAAEAAGFRACKRCRPDAPEQASIWRNRIEAACRAIEGADTTLSLAELARSAGMSPHHFHRRFKEMTGLTPKAYADAVRAARMRRDLPSARSVTQAAFDAGFNSSSRFYASARETLGMAPRKYRSGGAGLRLRVATSPCPLGIVLVAASETGIVAIFLGDDARALQHDLEARFPHAELISADKPFARLLADVVRLIERPAVANLPLDIQGTAFEHKVWNALREIPLGTTASYAEVAARIGAPKAARAVARACAANKIAVAIPCHRVVGSDGNLAGYRWGIDRKRQLLEQELEIKRKRQRERRRKT